MSPQPRSTIDTEKFRLRRFVDRLIQLGEVDVHDEPVPLSRLALHIDENPKAVLFRKAGPEQAEVVAGVFGSRRRFAEAFGVPEQALGQALLDRLEKPIEPVEIPSAAAPVHQEILTGTDADLTALPVHLQHERDGAPYISSAIDITRDPETGRYNVGFRRLMLRGRQEAGFNLWAPSDLKEAYRRCAARGERLPMSFVIGCHPLDSLVAMQRKDCDEIGLFGALRGEPAPVVRCVTNDLLVPADAEMVLEGYVDEHGYAEPEGPFGEWVGYYGEMRPNPVFHLTAITRRRDALFQSVSISGKRIDRTETAIVGAIEVEAMAWTALRTAVREPVAVHATAASNGTHHVRVALRQRVPGEARNAIAALFASVANIKHVFVVDEDVDVFSDARMEWAMSTRFQSDRDLVVQTGMRAIVMDPSLGGRFTGAKAGFDMTLPFGTVNTAATETPQAPRLDGAARFASVAEALGAGPMTFVALMEALGTDDGREIVRALEELRRAGKLTRLEHGEYALKS